jgi:rabenosyn-5
MDILRKRTFLEETASAKVEANSGETAMPDVADMMKRRTAALFELSLNATLMSTPPYVPYQAYRVCTRVFSPAHLTGFIARQPKRHSQTFSRSSVSPGPSSPRPISLHLHDTPSVRPATQLQQHSPETNKNVVPNGLHVVTAPSGSAASHLTRAPTPPSSTALTTEIVSVERAASSSSQPPSVPATPLPSTSSPVMVPDDRPTASSSTSSSPTSTRTRKTSTFRHVPARAAQTPIVPSTLSPGKDSRTTSLPSRTIDPNKPHRPHSRLSTVTFPSDPPQAPASRDVPVGRAWAISQSQSDANQLDRRTPSEATEGPSPTVLLPIPVQKTPSSSQSPTPAASASPVTSPSPPSTRTSTPVRSTAPYRPGFQPKGVYRPLTDEFLEVRRSRRDIGRVEQTRLERRLEKLINLHFGEDAADKRATARPKQAKRMSSIWELDIRSMAPGDIWRGVVQNQVTAGGKADIRGLCFVSNAERTLTVLHSFG